MNDCYLCSCYDAQFSDSSPVTFVPQWSQNLPCCKASGLCWWFTNQAAILLLHQNYWAWAKRRWKQGNYEKRHHVNPGRNNPSKCLYRCDIIKCLEAVSFYNKHLQETLKLVAMRKCSWAKHVSQYQVVCTKTCSSGMHSDHAAAWLFLVWSQAEKNRNLTDFLSVHMLCLKHEDISFEDESSSINVVSYFWMHFISFSQSVKTYSD